MLDRDTSSAFLSAEIDPAIPVIDLHSTDSISEALEKMERELFRLHIQRVRYCKVVHGIGSGLLADAVHRVLNKHPLVQAHQEAGNGGACLVLF